MWLPEPSFSYTENRFIRLLDIPSEITFDHLPDDTVSSFRSLVTEYKSNPKAAYDKIYHRHKEYMHTCKQQTLQNTGLIEDNFLQKPFVVSLPHIDYPMYTEALLLKLQTLDITYPMILACMYVAPRKQYTHTDFSAAYYIYCIKTGFIPTSKSNYIAEHYKYIETLRYEKYIVPQPQTAVEVIDVPLTPNDRPHRLNVRALDKPPMPKVLAYAYFDNIRVPYFIFSRWECEHYFVTPLQATTANKLLDMYGILPNNLLKPPNKAERQVLNLSDETNILNAHRVFSDKLKLEIFNLPEIVDFNVLLGLPPSNKKADMFLKLPIVRLC
jgi:hypothetical protein